MPDAASGLAKEARADAVGADGSCASPDAAAHRRIALLLSGVSRSGESPLGAGQSSDVPGSGGAAGASSASRPKGIGAKKAEGASGGHGSKGGKGGDGSSPKMALKAPESTKGSAGKASAGKASVGKGASSDKAGSVDHAEAAGTSSGGSATKKEGEPKVSRPRAETLKLIKARTSYQIFAEEERPAASAAARERVLATYQEAVGLRPDGKPKKVDEGEAAFKKDLQAAVVVELGKRWKALALEQKEPFEERARKEKEAVLKEAQAAAKRLASSGEGGHGKLREQIEAFGAKQPAAFLALFERLAADDLAVAARLEKQTVRDKQREAKEAEALRKLRYPIADELLANEPPHEPPLAEWPEPRYAINLPPEAQPCVGSLLAAFDFVSTYADPLGLTRFSLEELRLALLHRGPSVLLSEMALALLRFCLPEDPPSPDECAKARVPAGLARQAGAELTAAGLPCRGAPTRGVLTEASWVEVARWVLVRQAEGNDDTTVMRALEALRVTELWRLPLEQKLVVLLALIEAASASDAMRAVLSEHLERHSEALGAQREKEKEEREKENERRAAARAQKEQKHLT